MMNGHFIHKQVKALQGLGLNCHVLLTHNWFPPWGLHRLHVYWQTGYTQKKTYLDQYEGVPIHHVPVFVKMPSRFFSENAYQREADAIVSFIKRTDSLQNADWIYANFLTDCGYIGTLIKKKLKAKLAAIARGDDVHAWPTQNPALVHNLHEVFNKADLLLANSHGLGNDLNKWFRKEQNCRVHIIYNGIDADKFRPVRNSHQKNNLRIQAKLPEQVKLLICVATPVILKGWLELLEAVKNIGKEFDHWRLLAVFPKYHYADMLDLSKIVKSLGIESKVILRGAVDHDDMPKFFQMADAFVLPSHNEGLSNSLLEALACGLPVIATKVGGHPEVLKGCNAILVKPRSVNALKEAILQLLANDEVNYGQCNRDIIIRTVGSYNDGGRKLMDLMLANQN